MQDATQTYKEQESVDTSKFDYEGEDWQKVLAYHITLIFAQQQKTKEAMDKANALEKELAQVKADHAKEMADEHEKQRKKLDAVHD